MTRSTHATHLPALEEPHQREEVGHQLQTLLVELVDLSLLGKQMHWNVVGPLFRRTAPVLLEKREMGARPDAHAR
jgi:starvation-inducible DNA-binding protein